MKKSQGAVRFARPTGRSEAGRDVKTKRTMDDAALQRPTRCVSYARLIVISLTGSQAGAPGRKRKEGRDLWSLSDGAGRRENSCQAGSGGHWMMLHGRRGRAFEILRGGPIAGWTLPDTPLCCEGRTRAR